METNNELLILSLLNLYTSYINAKKKEDVPSKDRIYKPIAHTQSSAEGIQEMIMNSTATQGPTVEQEVDKTATAIDFKSSGKCSDAIVNQDTISTNAVLYNDQETHQGSSPENGANAMGATIVPEKEKVRRRRRRRGEPKEIKPKKPRIRRWRVRPINIDRARTGYHRKVFSNVKKMDQQQFFEHTRMTKGLYEWLLSFTHSSLRKSRQSILAEERLALTLNYLAYGSSLQSIAFKHKIGKSTARQIILDTCNVLVTLLSPLYLSKPTTAQYVDITDDFENKWNIPNCCGAIDGKRLIISNPRNKEDNSLFILAACDTKYKFSAVSVGKLNNDQCEDGLFKLLTSENENFEDDFPFPPNKPLFPSSPPFPHYFISDTSVFPLRKNIMCPYSEKNLDSTKSIFNFKMSRSRSIIENSFGILTARFRVLLTTVEFMSEACSMIVLACVALHNYIMTNDEDNLYCPPNFVDRENEAGIIEEGEWRNELKSNGDEPLPSMAKNNNYSTSEAATLRDTLANHFANEAISYEIEMLSEI